MFGGVWRGGGVGGGGGGGGRSRVHADRTHLVSDLSADGAAAAAVSFGTLTLFLPARVDVCAPLPTTAVDLRACVDPTRPDHVRCSK